MHIIPPPALIGGGAIEPVKEQFPSHTYGKSGVYTVKIYGKHDDVKLSIIKGEEWVAGSYSKIKNIIFSSEIEYLLYCFSDSDFHDFDSSPDMFRYCNKLKMIKCFKNCTSITSIPQGLFDNCLELTHLNHYAMGGCFEDCINLISIPQGLFDHCLKIYDIDKCFKNCKSLKSIPQGLFDNCSNIVSIMRCFEKCILLTSIPHNLFDHCPNVTDFSNCFLGCTNLTGETPYTMINGEKVKLWQRAGKEGFPSRIYGSDCFRGCTKLSDYNEIPDEWITFS